MMNMKSRIRFLLVLLLLSVLFLLRPNISGAQSYSTEKEVLDRAKELHAKSPQMPLIVIVRGVHERGYRVYTDSSYSGKTSLVIEIPTYVGGGDDTYCAMLDHLRGLRGRGNRILNALKKIQEDMGDIQTSILHSGAVVALKNVAGSPLFQEVFQKGKMGKVAFAGAYAGPGLSRAMNGSGIPWRSFAYGDDMIVAITRTNLQSVGLSGQFRLTPLQLMLFPLRTAAWAVGGPLKIPHLLLFPVTLKHHPLQAYKGDIVSWLTAPEGAEKEKGKEPSQKDGEEGDQASSDDGDDENNGNHGGPGGDDGGGGGGGPGGGGPGGGSGGGSGGSGHSPTLSSLTGNGNLSSNISAQDGGTVSLEMQKNTPGPLDFLIPNATPLENDSGGQSLGM